ncbi:MAG: ABC transporter substrate-binding protein [Candidatus Thorarchaeota archaeon]
MERKAQIAVGVIAIIAVAAIVGGVVVFLMGGGIRLGDTIIFGTMEGPSDLDPHLAWDSGSIDVIDQVAEGLVRVQFKDTAGNNINELRPHLATDDPLTITSTVVGAYDVYFDGGDNSDPTDPTDLEWHSTQVKYTFNLVQNATFHDGRKFNATSVYDSFYRLNYLLNVTGTLPDTVGVTQVAELYEWPNTRLYNGIFADRCLMPIINSTNIVSEYVIEFILNKEYKPFIPLLGFSASYIFIPLDSDGVTELWTDYMVTTEDGFLGTGPWSYDHYEDGVEVIFNYNPTYWRGASELKKLVFSVINDANARNQALLAGDIHFLDDPLPSLYDTFRTDPNTELPYAGGGLVVQYLGMNSVLLNVTWKNAIAWAIDYDYIVEEWWEGNAVRCEGPIPDGITYCNWTGTQEPVTDLEYARGIMQSMGYGYDSYGNPWGIDPDTDDDGVVDDPTDDTTNNYNWSRAATRPPGPFLIVNFTYNIGNQFREDILTMITNQLSLLGIQVTGAGMTWTQFIYRLYEVGNLQRNMLQLYWIGWGPDYNDPSNFINPLFTNRSIASNGGQYDGYRAAEEAAVAFNSGAAYAADWFTWTDAYVAGTGPRDPLNLWDNVQLLMEAGLVEPDPARREAMYTRIQMLLIEQDMGWVYGYCADQYDAHIVQLEGYPYNNFGKNYFYPLSFAT